MLAAIDLGMPRCIYSTLLFILVLFFLILVLKIHFFSFSMTKVSFRGLSRLRNGRKIKDFVTFHCPHVSFFLVAKCQVIYATTATYFSPMYVFFSKILYLISGCNEDRRFNQGLVIYFCKLLFCFIIFAGN